MNVLREFRLRVALREMFAMADEIRFSFDLDPTINRAREADTSGLMDHRR
jgi:hypothetical protein